MSENFKTARLLSMSRVAKIFFLTLNDDFSKCGSCVTSSKDKANFLKVSILTIFIHVLNSEAKFRRKIYNSCKYLRANRIAIDPSPTAEEIPAIAPALTSPEAKIPGTLVSGMNGSLVNFQNV